MKPCRNLNELQKKLYEIHSVVAADTAFCAYANLFIAEKLVAIEKLLTRLPTRRRPSNYQNKLGRLMSQGKSLKEAHALLKARDKAK